MIEIITDPLGNDRAFEVTSTGPVPEKPTLERAACEVAHILGDPGAGITYLDVLTLPEEVQHKVGFHSEEITAEEEYIDGKILLSDNVEIHHYNEYLVKPQSAREDEIAAFIEGYCEALYRKGVPGFSGNMYYLIQDMTAKSLAKDFIMGRRLDLPAFIEEKIEDMRRFEESCDEADSEEEI